MLNLMMKLNTLYEDIDVKRFESKTEIKEITKNFTETKEKNI